MRPPLRPPSTPSAPFDITTRNGVTGTFTGSGRYLPNPPRACPQKCRVAGSAAVGEYLDQISCVPVTTLARLNEASASGMMRRNRLHGKVNGRLLLESDYTPLNG